MKRRNVAAWALAAILLAPIVLADDKPRTGTPKLSAMAAQLEARGYDPIVEMAFENGLWDVEAYKRDRKLDLVVDAMTGKILDESPDYDDD